MLLMPRPLSLRASSMHQTRILFNRFLSKHIENKDFHWVLCIAIAIQNDGGCYYNIALKPLSKILSKWATYTSQMYYPSVYSILTFSSIAWCAWNLHSISCFFFFCSSSLSHIFPILMGLWTCCGSINLNAISFFSLGKSTSKWGLDNKECWRCYLVG